MVPLRIIFFVMIIVTVASVSGSVNTRGASKFSQIKSQLKDKSSKLGEKLKELSGSSKAEKAKGWGKSAHTKIKGVSEKHPKLKSAGEKLWGKVSGMKKSASESKKGSKARGLVNNANTKAKEVLETVKKQVRNVKTMVRSARTAAAVHSKLSGLSKTFSRQRSVGGSTTALKNAVRSGSEKFSSLKDKGAISLGSLKEKSAAKLGKIKGSETLKKMQAKLPASSLDKLKKLPGADKLKGLTSGNTEGAAASFKNRLSSIKNVAGKASNLFSSNN